jgi:hypothetical protein
MANMEVEASRFGSKPSSPPFDQYDNLASALEKKGDVEVEVKGGPEPVPYSHILILLWQEIGPIFRSMKCLVESVISPTA